MLDFLDAAADTRDIRAYKPLRFEKLKGNLDGFHSVRITGTGQRIIFEVDGPALREIYQDDYH